MDGFESFDCFDYMKQFEFITENKSNLPPIILVPGVAGSKIEAINRKSGNIEVAWISDAIPRTISNICEHMWGAMNETTGEFESFTNKYTSIEAIPGVKGCDYLVDGNVV